MSACCSRAAMPPSGRQGRFVPEAVMASLPRRWILGCRRGSLRWGGDGMERRLAAIVAADVVGYSRLMEQDETGTMVALKARRKEVLEPLVARFEGRVFKVVGDGVLVEFGSAVKAIECAVELQQRMTAANSDLPEACHILLRIGLNLGD